MESSFHPTRQAKVTPGAISNTAINWRHFNLLFGDFLPLGKSKDCLMACHFCTLEAETSSSRQEGIKYGPVGITTASLTCRNTI